MSQANYEAVLTSLDTANENQSIQTVCELFLLTMYANQRNSSYDISIYSTDATELDETLMYMQSHNDYLREIRMLFNYSVVNDSLSFDDCIVNINADSCEVEIGVHYEYELTNWPDEVCQVNCVYYLILTKGEEGWRIDSAKSSQAVEQQSDFTYDAFDGCAAALAVKNSQDYAVHVESAELTGASTATPSATPSFTIPGYSRTAAVNYAKQYFNTANSKFTFMDGENCQNFAAQCVWAGLLSGCGANGSSITAIPAISTSRSGSDAPNLWCHNQCTTYYSHYTNNWMWDNVNGFLRLIYESNYKQEGPQGGYYFGLAQACDGDVIIVDFQGTRSYSTGSYDHAMVVTKATGTAGSRGPANLFVAANTSATTSAYQPLTEYCGYSSEYFGTAHIIEGYYILIEMTSVGEVTPW